MSRRFSAESAHMRAWLVADSSAWHTQQRTDAGSHTPLVKRRQAHRIIYRPSP